MTIQIPNLHLLNHQEASQQALLPLFSFQVNSMDFYFNFKIFALLFFASSVLQVVVGSLIFEIL